MREERGSTLMELVVGMMIMLIFLGMFSGAIVMLYQSSNKANALTTGAAQTDTAFARLDRSIRYASAFTSPALAGDGNWYVEYLTTNTGSPVCTQLRVTASTQQLQMRTWIPSSDGTSYTGLTSWLPWASGVTNGGVAATSTNPPPPFVLVYSKVAYEQLTVNLVASSGNPAVPAQTNATFTALNSTAAAAQAAPLGPGLAVSGCGQVPRS